MIYELGTRFGDLTLIERIPASKDAKTVWVLECTCGAITRSQSGNVTSGRKTSCGAHGRGFGRKETHVPRNYQSVHALLRSRRGPASSYQCINCDKRAAHWSYDGYDHNELLDTSNGSIVAYSTDLSHYDPRCIKCHKRYDLAAVGARNIVLDALGRTA